MTTDHYAGRAEDRGATEPRIRYVTAADGVRIAYWTLGEGSPLVYLAGRPWNHVELWQVPECRRWYERLAAGRMLVRYDVRGTGWSEREVSDYSLDALVLDLEAVADRLGLTKFALLGAADAGPVALAYAERHPERVSHLILWCTWARGADVQSPRLMAWVGLLGQDWELMTDTCAHLALGWSGGGLGRQAAQLLRERMTPAGMRAALDASAAFDVTVLLPRVRAPTLVLHRQAISWLPVDIARELTARLPDGRLILIEGESTAPYLGDAGVVASAIDAFLHEEDERQPTVLSGTGPAALAPRVAPRAYPDGLTGREVEVLRLVAGGRTNKEIAEELSLSVRTVERHIGNAYRKINGRGRADATLYALTRGLL